MFPPFSAQQKPCKTGIKRKDETDMRRVVEVTNVKKSFGKLQVLDGVDFHMEEGDLW